MKDRFESDNKISKDNSAMFAYARDGTFNGYITKKFLE